MGPTVCFPALNDFESKAGPIVAGHPLAVQWMNLKETQQRPAFCGNMAGSKGGGGYGKNHIVVKE